MRTGALVNCLLADLPQRLPDLIRIVGVVLLDRMQCQVRINILLLLLARLSVYLQSGRYFVQNRSFPLRAALLAVEDFQFLIAFVSFADAFFVGIFLWLLSLSTAIIVSVIVPVTLRRLRTHLLKQLARHYFIIEFDLCTLVVQRRQRTLLRTIIDEQSWVLLDGTLPSVLVHYNLIYLISSVPRFELY